MCNEADFIISNVEYNPDTGILTWARPASGRRMGVPIGSRKRMGNRYYRRIRCNGHEYTAARIAWAIMTGSLPDFNLTYADGDSENLIWTNIIRGDKCVSHRNLKMSCRSASGYIGIYPHADGFKVYIGTGDGGKYVGFKKHLSDARALRAEKEKELGYGCAHAYISK